MFAVAACSRSLGWISPDLASWALADQSIPRRSLTPAMSRAIVAWPFVGLIRRGLSPDLRGP